MTYAFILGREHLLSAAEIKQSLFAEGSDFSVISQSEEVLLVETDGINDDFFHRLGGSIKYAIVDQFDLGDIISEAESFISASVEMNKRFRFGISVYKAAFEQNSVNNWQDKFHDLGFTMKAQFKEGEISARYVTARTPQLSSVVVTKSKLLEQGGIEVLVVIGADQAWMGKTEAVQDFQTFSHRDFGRPARDDYSGMLPPKLARMMINLSGLYIDKQSTVLDPFCGSGTVLQEALLLGAGKVLGSDVSDKAVKDSQENIEWLLEQESIDASVSIEQVDVKEVSNWVPEQHVDVIVTEPFLGEPVRSKLSKGDIIQRQKDLSDLYDLALEQMHKVLKDSGRVVMIFPFIADQRVPLPTSFKKLWSVVNLPNNEDSERGGLDYIRPKQKVGREVFVLEKK